MGLGRFPPSTVISFNTKAEHNIASYVLRFIKLPVTAASFLVYLCKLLINDEGNGKVEYTANQTSTFGRWRTSESLSSATPHDDARDCAHIPTWAPKDVMDYSSTYWNCTEITKFGNKYRIHT